MCDNMKDLMRIDEVKWDLQIDLLPLISQSYAKSTRRGGSQRSSYLRSGHHGAKLNEDFT